MDFNAVALFVKVVQHGSFSETARRTNIPVATVSRRIQALEATLGVRLLERSTRRLHLTDAGTSFWQFANQGIEAFETGLATLDRDQVDFSGRLRLSLPPGFMPWRQLLREFQTCYPNVTVDVLVTERRVDLIEDGIDVALRIGDRKHQHLISQKLGEYRHLLVASPNLLQKYRVPQSPKQLLQMPCASWKAPADTTVWLLGNQSIQIAPQLQVNDYLHLLELAVAGVYVTELPPFLAQAAIANGDLVHLLEDYPLPASELNLLYPSRRHLSHLVKTYIGFCSQWVVDLFQT
ncbi:MAG: LysR family transcriptional regulator [Cyanobacteria bacterium P01_D01_bin.71]